jgi:hypothetical protein
VESAVALGAIRRLSVDVANLSGQAALLQSGVEYARLIAQGVQPDDWDKVMLEDDEGRPEMQVTLRGEQIDAVMRLLAALDSLE